VKSLGFELPCYQLLIDKKKMMMVVIILKSTNGAIAAQMFLFLQSEASTASGRFCSSPESPFDLGFSLAFKSGRLELEAPSGKFRVSMNRYYVGLGLGPLISYAPRKALRSILFLKLFAMRQDCFYSH
jgi:hypothetical protein